MKIKNIKLKVETDEQNQYVLQKHLDLNKGCKWLVTLNYGTIYWLNQDYTPRAVCSRWKGFRHLVINDYGDLILCLYEEYYNRREETEITFEEFKEMVGDTPKQDIDLGKITAVFDVNYHMLRETSNEQTIQICDDCEIVKVEGNTIHIKKKEPKKTLWDKRDYIASGDKIYHFKSGDVQEALKEFIDWLNEDEPKDNIYTKKAKEIFGEELLE